MSGWHAKEMTLKQKVSGSIGQPLLGCRGGHIQPIGSARQGGVARYMPKHTIVSGTAGTVDS